MTGVWVGNSDNSPMLNVSGVTGAGPIWNQFMTAAHDGEPVVAFSPPPGVRQYEICADTGALPSQACPARRQRYFAEDRPPLPQEKDLWQLIRLDKTSGRLANEFTPAKISRKRSSKSTRNRTVAGPRSTASPSPRQYASTVFPFEPELFVRSRSRARA